MHRMFCFVASTVQLLNAIKFCITQMPYVSNSMALTNQVMTSWSFEKVLATYLALKGDTLASGHIALALEQTVIFLSNV